MAVDAGAPLSALSIFLLVAAMQIIDGFLDHLKKRGIRSNEEMRLRQEIRQLLKEASSLSTPSTFAQAAKLRRLAAAKEKELIRKQEEQGREIKSSYDLYTRALLVFKVFSYAGLSWWFWGIPVAKVPQHLLHPFGKFLTWKAGDVTTGEIMVVGDSIALPSPRRDNTLASSDLESQQVLTAEAPPDE